MVSDLLIDSHVSCLVPHLALCVVLSLISVLSVLVVLMVLQRFPVILNILLLF